jgi:hypothetical protein
MDDTNEVSDVVSQLVEQLKQTASIVDKKQKEARNERLSTNDIEDLIVDSSSKLVKGSVEAIEDLRKLVLTAPNAEDVEALSRLITASATAIESLNKIYITNRKIETAKELKKIDVENKQKMQQTDIQGKLLINREELLKQMIDEAKVVDVEVVDIKQGSQ